MKYFTPAVCRTGAIAVGIIEAVRLVVASHARWGDMMGWEAYWIANTIAAGHGFSFSSQHRWLFEQLADSNFHATAWADPLYTYGLAAMISLFGEHHQLVAVGVNLLLLLLLIGMSYRLCERLVSAPTGLLVTVVLALDGAHRYTIYMQNTALATTLILATSIALVHFCDYPTKRRAIVLGFLMGATILGCPSALLFLPVTTVALVVMAFQQNRITLIHAILTTVVAIMVISPWTMRNYLEFGEFVPVRNGAGHLAFVGVIAASGAIAPDTLTSRSKPSWNVSRDRDILYRWSEQSHRRDLEAFQMEYADENGGDNYAKMNEAQRDKWLMQQAKTFAADHPFLFLKLSALKLEAFVRIMGRTGIIICVFAALGALIAFVRRDYIALIFTSWVAAYVMPFLIIICYFPRYRFPIEPLMMLLATIPIRFTITYIWRSAQHTVTAHDEISPAN